MTGVTPKKPVLTMVPPTIFAMASFICRRLVRWRAHLPATLPGRAIWCSLHLRKFSRRIEVGSFARRRAVSACPWRVAGGEGSLGERPAARRGTGVMGLARLGFALAKPLLHAMDAETAHGLTISMLKAMPLTKPATLPRRLARRGFRAFIRQSAGACSWLRQERRGAGCHAVARLRLHRSGNGDTAPARWKRQATAVSPRRRTEVSSTAWASTMPGTRKPS